MEWSSSSSPEKTPHDVGKIDHKKIFKAYSTISIPTTSSNEKKSKTPAQDRLMRLQNALREETQKTQKIEQKQQPKVPPPQSTSTCPNPPPRASPKRSQATKRKALQEEVKVVPEKKRLVGDSPPAMPKRPTLRAKGANKSVNDRLKRPLMCGQSARAIPSTSKALNAIPRATSATVTSGARTTDQTMASPPKKLKSSPNAMQRTKIISPPRNGKDYRISVRNSKDNRLIVDYEDFANPLETPMEPSERVKDLSKTFHVVVDTNVFCHNLIFLENIINMRIVASGYAILFIPYIVIQELDHLKHQQTELNTAAKAIRFINDKVQARHPQIKGQTANQELLIQTPTADDSIINCCLQLKSTTKKIILLSNDTNLRNKAIFNGINAYRPKDIKQDVPIEFL